MTKTFPQFLKRSVSLYIDGFDTFVLIAMAGAALQIAAIYFTMLTIGNLAPWAREHGGSIAGAPVGQSIAYVVFGGTYWLAQIFSVLWPTAATVLAVRDRERGHAFRSVRTYLRDGAAALVSLTKRAVSEARYVLPEHWFNWVAYLAFVLVADALVHRLANFLLPQETTLAALFLGLPVMSWQAIFPSLLYRDAEQRLPELARAQPILRAMNHEA